MERKYPHIFTPLQVAGLTLRNRIMAAPMAYPVSTSEGSLPLEAAAYFGLRAKGGAAVVTVSEGTVHTATGMSHSVNIQMDSPGVLTGLSAVAYEIKRHGAIASLELNHSGKHSNADFIDKSKNKENVRYGPVAEVLENGAEIQEMPQSLIDTIVEAYGNAAAVAKKAGFEMIMLHAGHGWLLHQFLSPRENHRTDKYGGSIENCVRLTLEVLDAIRAKVGLKFAIEIRLSADEVATDGYTFEEFIEIVKLLESRVDLIHISAGAHEGSFDVTHQSMFAERGGLVHWAAEVKKHVSKPVTAIGALAEPAMVEEIIASGKADVVAMGRQFLADPYWPVKAMQGKDEEIVRCCRCFTCMAERMTTGLRVCALNPEIGRELELKSEPAKTTPKKVLIAGGGPGGLVAAITAANRGHKVVLAEKTSWLGGALRAERGIPFKADLFDYVRVKELEARKAGVEIRLNTEVTPEYAAQEVPDVLLVAVGATPIVPPLPGIDGDNVIIGNDLPDHEQEVGQKVVILGGGLVGAETAVHLAQEGKDVTIVEMLDDIAKDANGRHRPILIARLKKEGVTSRPSCRGLRVTSEGLVVENAEGSEELLSADTIVCAVGQRPLRKVAESLKDSAPVVWDIGDCVRPGQVTQATFRGFFAALDI
ncbi:MAG: FAD-dependent oxidoreductase [Clostridiales Family XIII bacterium]|jgi:2,4-dienoyl-CoA reductase-like NADH-dependent reductase (Old Yellow Enzyme family)/thioredoxin reductase|nr:FAD-dependent oxidoreductase [Clostridiales Family XIII bacterium]